MRNVVSKVAAAAAILMGVATSADAFVILSMKDISGGFQQTLTCDTSAGVTATNCGAGFTILNPDFVNFSGNVGDFHVVSTQGVNNVPGDPNVATANTTSLTIHRNDAAAGSQDLVVDFTSFVFTKPTGELKNLDGSASMTGNFFSAGDQIFSAFSVDSNAGTAFVAGPTVWTASCLMAAAPSNKCDSPQIQWPDPAAGVAGFSTRTQQLFSLQATSTIDATTRLKVTLPEPMSVSLVGVALLGLGLASRRRRVSPAA